MQEHAQMPSQVMEKLCSCCGHSTMLDPETTPIRCSAPVLCRQAEAMLLQGPNVRGNSPGAGRTTLAHVVEQSHVGVLHCLQSSTMVEAARACNGVVLQPRGSTTATIGVCMQADMDQMDSWIPQRASRAALSISWNFQEIVEPGGAYAALLLMHAAG